MKKIIISIAGGVLVLLGLIFLIIPGPSILLLIPGLAILSIEYPIARSWLKKVQKIARNVAVMIDKAVLRKKYR